MAPLSLSNSDLMTDLQIIKQTHYISLQETSVTEFETFMACMCVFYFILFLEKSFSCDSNF